MRQLAPHTLWTGNARDLNSLELIYDHEIVAVVQLALEEPPPRLPREIALLRFPLTDDGENAEWILRAAIDFIAGLTSRKVKSLVGCGAGMSRSPAVCAAALAILEGNPPGNVLARIATEGPTDVSPQLWKSVAKLVGNSPNAC